MGKRKQKYQEKNSKTTLYVIGGVLLLALSVIVFANVKPTSNVVFGDGELDEFAKCLTDSGAVFYGTEWCSYCNEQKEMFGDSMAFVDFVDCDANRNECSQEGIRSFPTWKIDGQAYVGLQELTRLSDITGCEVFA